LITIAFSGKVIFTVNAENTRPTKIFNFFYQVKIRINNLVNGGFVAYRAFLIHEHGIHGYMEIHCVSENKWVATTLMYINQIL